MLENIREYQEDIEETVRELQEQFETLRSQMESSDQISEETRNSYRELQQLMDELDDPELRRAMEELDRKSTRLNSSHVAISYAVFCLKKKNKLSCIFLTYSLYGR